MTATSRQLIATAGSSPVTARMLCAIERPSRIAMSGGTIAALSAIVAAVARTRRATNSGPLRGGGVARNTYATASAGVAAPATLMSSARQRYRSTTHTAT